MTALSVLHSITRHDSLGRDGLTEFPTWTRAQCRQRRILREAVRESMNNIARQTLNPFYRALSTHRLRPWNIDRFNLVTLHAASFFTAGLYFLKQFIRREQSSCTIAVQREILISRSYTHVTDRIYNTRESADRFASRVIIMKSINWLRHSLNPLTKTETCKTADTPHFQFQDFTLWKNIEQIIRSTWKCNRWNCERSATASRDDTR